MKQKIITKLKAGANAEANKGFSEDWGLFWWVSGELVGKYTLGFLGWAADSLILFSILYAGTKRFWLSLIIAAIICTIMQVITGSATFKITKAFKTGKYRENAYVRSIAAAGLVSVLILSASLWFSFNTKDVYEVAAQDALQAQIKDEAEVLTYYDSKAAQTRSMKAEAVNNIKTQIETWAKVTWKGAITSKAQRKIAALETELTNTQNRYDADLDKIEEERRAELAIVRGANTEAVDTFKSKILKGGTTFRWVNISINILRLLLIIGWAIARMDMASATAQRNATPEPQPQYIPVAHKGETPENRVSNWEKRDLLRVAEDLKKAKAQLRAYRSKLRKGQGVPETNTKRIRELEIEISGYETLLSSGG